MKLVSHSNQEEIHMAFMDKVKGMLGIPEDADEMYEKAKKPEAKAPAKEN